MNAEEYNHINDVIEDLYEHGKLTEEDFDNLCRWIDEADRLEKCRWHDLRKDPSDLPSETNLYLIAYKEPYGEKIHTNLEVYHDWEKEWGTPKGYEVVAWKDVEPFEEVKE